MKKFKFRLTAVLKVAQIKKERAEIAFAEATNALIKEKESLKVFELELEAGLKSYDYSQVIIHIFSVCARKLNNKNM